MKRIAGIDIEFEKKALALFQKQAMENSVYKEFLEIIKFDANSVQNIAEIPFLPIELFKHKQIKTGSWPEEKKYFSSGTSAQTRSIHFVKDEKYYLRNALEGFEYYFGDVKDWIFVAYLPGYTENPSSSLIAMVNDLIFQSQNNQGGFVAFDPEVLREKLIHIQPNGKKIMLIGVAYALWDFCRNIKMQLPDLFILETGGMKGKDENIDRASLHTILSNGFGTQKVFSEYGMTELFSQAYTSLNEKLFRPTPNMRVLVKDVNDPFEMRKNGKYGLIHIVDLANESTCAFLATQDIGILYDNGHFDVLGRLESADLRGCSMLYFSM